MSDNQSEMQSYCAARAAEYDRIYLKSERQADLRAIERWRCTMSRRTNIQTIGR